MIFWLSLVLSLGVNRPLHVFMNYRRFLYLEQRMTLNLDSSVPNLASPACCSAAASFRAFRRSIVLPLSGRFAWTIDTRILFKCPEHSESMSSSSLRLYTEILMHLSIHSLCSFIKLLYYFLCQGLFTRTVTEIRPV